MGESISGEVINMNKRVSNEQLLEQTRGSELSVLGSLSKVNKNLLSQLTQMQSTLNRIHELLTTSESKTEEPKEETRICPIHGEEMYYQTKGPYKPFWTHGKQVGEGRWVNCHGQGY